MPPKANSLADPSSGASSPDPLTFATSPAPGKGRATRRTSRFAQPLAPRSPNVAASDPFLDRPIHERTTPSKSLTMSTPGGRGASPWRIKVTVEAEQDDDDDCITVKRPSTRIETKTTTIPVKGLESSSPVKKGRGRPRKSDTAPPATQKRNGTPIRRRRKSVTKSPEDESDSSFNDATFPPKNRQQSRKSTAKDTQVPEPIRATLMYGPRSTEGTPVPERNYHNSNESPFGEPDPASQPASSIGRRRSTRLSRRLSDAAAETSGPVQQPQGPAADTERHNSSESGKDAEMWRAMTSNYEYESEETAEGQGEEDEDGEEQEDEENEDDEEEEEYSDDGGFEMTMPDVTVPDITVPDVVGDTTMINSENFSMVSIDSLPSRQAALSSPLARKAIANQQQQSAKGPSRQLNFATEKAKQSIDLPSAPPPEPEPNEESLVEDSALSVSYMPSSPPVRFSAPTPKTVKSPPAPPATKAASRPSPKKPTVLKLVNVVRAGLALQGVVNGNNRGTLDRRPSDDIRERAQLRRLDKVFNDFKPKTRRELQAGLRLGQQLAERARSRATTRETTRDPSPPQKESQTGNDVSGRRVAVPPAGSASDSNEQRLPTPEENDHASTAQLSSEQQVSYPKLNTESQPVQLVSPARSQISDDGMSWKANTPPSTKASSQEEGQEGNSRPINFMDYEDSVLQQQPGEDFDHYWQRRRETISKKIQDANASQVIVINSDEGSSELSEQNLQDSDIWEEEASRDSSTRASRRRQRQASPQQQQSTLASGSNASKSRHGRVAESPKDGEPINAQASKGAEELKAGSQSEPSSNSSERAKTPETVSDDADSTGIFWQKPDATASKQPEPSQLKSDKMDLSMLLGTNDIPQKSNAFNPQRMPENMVFKAPYNAGTKLTSPTRGSPLKQQVVFSSPTAASSSPYSKISHSIEASALLQDSVLDSSMAQEGDSMTSDIRQLRAEAEAYRNMKSLTPRNDHPVHQNEDVEIEDAPAMPEERIQPSPHRGNTHMTSLHLGSNRDRKPLFAAAPTAPAAPKPTTPEIHPSHVQALQALQQQQQQQQSNSGVFSRVWSTLGSSNNAATPTPTPLHPLAAPMPALPKHAPWTNTHYRALDALYQHSKASPRLFSPTNPLNASLLSAPRPTARLSSRTGQLVWSDTPLSSYRGQTMPLPGGGGGTLTLTDEMLVVAGAFLQLLTLETAGEFKAWTGRELEPARGRDEPLRVGEQIWAWAVLARLASVVHGEEVREGERRARREARGVRA
ncbi:uncharacterized protein K452DRAFT_322115 [Aplosporella prunicola CBS 121167]|uniref:Uncharacterized protein n=1 Tax=Aplosporella prunicola CBS 121167 TaxID=1176127 RepID=A0A6A6B2M7_9PEZI|nr:uncharacterized protein K452DRAFT_322115 [Aplosporella prunicola CBS 121167]KAF2136981.1 hypothetical protein K452DRAFT_322115 [Aplosporella prunicola CBS 121167]